MTPESKVNEEQERVAFEAWASNAARPWLPLEKTDAEPAGYFDAFTDTAWEAWLARARASRPITREGLEKALDVAGLLVWENVIDGHTTDLIAALRSLGVEVGDG